MFKKKNEVFRQFDGLQLKEVADLKRKTVYTHQTLLVAQMFVFALRSPFFLGAVMGWLF